MRQSNKGCDWPNCGCDHINNCDTHEVEHEVELEKTVRTHIIGLLIALVIVVAAHFVLDYYDHLPDKKAKQYDRSL